MGNCAAVTVERRIDICCRHPAGRATGNDQTFRGIIPLNPRYRTRIVITRLYVNINRNYQLSKGLYDNSQAFAGTFHGI